MSVDNCAVSAVLSNDQISRFRTGHFCQGRARLSSLTRPTPHKCPCAGHINDALVADKVFYFAVRRIILEILLIFGNGIVPSRSILQYQMHIVAHIEAGPAGSAVFYCDMHDPVAESFPICAVFDE